MSEELKPCPFCGWGNIKHHNSGGMHIIKNYYVSCTRCGARGARKETEEEAISAWNKRVENKEA